MNKVLTISIAAYNVEAYLQKCLDSLLVDEILQDLEIIIENDGSQDATADIGAQYVKQYPDTVRLINKENGGYGSTINRSIQEASGKYFKQLDADDWYQTENLTEFVALLKNTDADIVFTPLIRYYEGSEKTERKDLLEYIPEGFYEFKDLTFKNYVNMHSSTFKTSILKKMRRSITEHCFYTDTELVCFPLPYIQTAYVWHQPIYVYRLGRDGQSVSLSGLQKHYKEHERVLWHLYGVEREIPDDEQAKKQFMKIRLVMETSDHIYYIMALKDKEEGVEEIKKFVEKAKQLNPTIWDACMKEKRLNKLLIGSHYKLYNFLKRMIHID